MSSAPPSFEMTVVVVVDTDVYFLSRKWISFLIVMHVDRFEEVGAFKLLKFTGGSEKVVQLTKEWTSRREQGPYSVVRKVMQPRKSQESLKSYIDLTKTYLVFQFAGIQHWSMDILSVATRK